MKHHRGIIATLVAALGLSNPLWAQGEAGSQPTSPEMCLITPDPGCMNSLVIPDALAQDSPGVRLQEMAESLLERGEQAYARQLLEAAIEIGFDGFSTTTGFGANSDLWTVSRIGRFLDLLEQNGFADLQRATIDMLDGFVEGHPESNAREDALYQMFSAFLDLGAHDDALSTADRMASKWRRYGDVAVAYAEAGRTDDAVALSDAIGNSALRLEAKARVSQTLAERGRIELAIEVLPSGAPGIEVTNAHKAIASALVLAGRTDEAIAYADALPGPFRRSYVQDSTAGALAAIGEFGLALALADRISLGQQRAQALASVGEILVAQGEVDRARDILARFPSVSIWKDPVDESIDEARTRLEQAIDAAVSR